MMHSEVLYLSNIKCDGCVKAIKEVLETREDIDFVEVDKELGKVTVTGEDFDKEDIAVQLALMGYPEKLN